MSNFTSASGGLVLPTVEEDATITAAALSDPDAQPLTDAQLGAMVPMKTLCGWQARMDGVLREYVARQAQTTPQEYSHTMFTIVETQLFQKLARNSRRSAVPSNAKRPLSDQELETYEAGRDLAADLLQSIKEMKAGQTQVVHSPAIEARQKTGLSQARFAALLGVSVRTLQGWEQGRKQPSGAARTLLTIARTHPEILLEVGAHYTA